jgi:hypothetical protein
VGSGSGSADGITGTVRAGGGQGASSFGGNGSGPGGPGGGGAAGDTNNSQPGQPGVGGKGGGGGGSAGSAGVAYRLGGAGGSGIVIIKYLMSAGAKSGGTVTNDGTYYYNTFTGSGTFTI